MCVYNYFLNVNIFTLNTYIYIQDIYLIHVFKSPKEKKVPKMTTRDQEESRFLKICTQRLFFKLLNCLSVYKGSFLPDFLFGGRGDDCTAQHVGS